MSKELSIVDGLKLHNDLLNALRKPNFSEVCEDVKDRLNAEIRGDDMKRDELEVGDEVAAYDGRVGKVTKINGDHAVVRFAESDPKQGTYTEEWRICDLGRKVNTDPTTDLKVGDRVKIADDSPLARRILKESNAGYGDYKFEMFGWIGTVIHIDPSAHGGEQCRVDVGTGSENAWWWPSVLLTKLPDEKTWLKEAMASVSNVEPPKCVPLKCRCVVDPAPKTRNTKIAEIVFDHVVVSGKCMLQIAEINGILGGDDLPKEYYWDADPNRVLLSAGPRMFHLRWDGPTDEMKRFYGGLHCWSFAVGDCLTEAEAAKLVKRMKACGDRLHKINAAARAEKDAARFEAWKAKGRNVVRI